MHKGLQPAHEWLCKGAAWKGIVVLTTVAVAENRYTRGYAIGRALVPLGSFLPHFSTIDGKRGGCRDKAMSGSHICFGERSEDASS